MKRKIGNTVTWAILIIYAIVVQYIIIIMSDRIMGGWSVIRMLNDTPKALVMALIHTSPLLILNLIYKKYKKRYNYFIVVVLIVLIDIITPVYGGIGIVERIVSTADKMEIRKSEEIDKQHIETILTGEYMEIRLNNKKDNESVIYEGKHTLLKIEPTEQIEGDHKPIYKILTEETQKANGEGEAGELVYVNFLIHPDDLETALEDIKYTILSIGESNKIYRLPIKTIDILNKLENTIYLADNIEIERDKYEIKVTNRELNGTELWSFYRDGELVVQNNNPYSEDKSIYNIIRTSEKEIKDIFDIIDASKDIRNPLNKEGKYSICLIDYDEQLDRHIIVSNILYYKR